MSHDVVSSSGRKSNAHDEINEYIKRLSRKGFPISPRARYESPKGTPMKERPCTSLIKYIYFQTIEETRSQVLENLVMKLESLPLSNCTIEILQSNLQQCRDELMNNRLSSSKRLKSDTGREFTSTTWLSIRDKTPQNIGEKRNLPEDELDVTDYESDDSFATAPASPSPSHRRSLSRKISRNRTTEVLRRTTAPEVIHSFGSTTSGPSFGPSLGASTVNSFDRSTFNPLTRSRMSDDTDITDVDEEPQVFESAISGRSSSQLYGVSSSTEAAFGEVVAKGPGILDHSHDSSSMFSMDTDTMRKTMELVTLLESQHSPRKSEYYKIRDLPRQGFCIPPQPLDKSVPFSIRYEYTRMSLTHPNTAISMPEQYTDYDQFWASIEQSTNTSFNRCSQKAWQVALEKETCGPDLSISLTARLSFNTKKHLPELFALGLQPMQVGKNCRFQRKFGGDRFLNVYVPDSSKIPEHGRDQENHLTKRLLEWMMKEKEFLGRTWRAVYMEPYQKKGALGFQHRIVFFATSGFDISTVSVRDIFSWFMSLSNVDNLSLPYLKAFCRLSLGFSKTSPTIVFNPAEVHTVDDILPDGATESVEFLDENIAWSPSKASGTMNDGCSCISVAACKAIWQKLDNTGMVPSVFQARISGAKGVWIRSGPSDASSGEHRIPWLQINSKQRKFFPHDEDTDSHIETDRWTFEVVKYSAKPKSSTLHSSFIPILIDRGITKEIISKFVTESLSKEREDILSSISDSKSLLNWLQRVGSVNVPNVPRGQWAIPAILTEKIMLLIQSGFEPKQLSFLNKILTERIEQYLLRVAQNFSIRLPRSTYVIGIADPKKVLKPGEVFLAFSHSFPIDQDRIPHLLNEVLITRHPALRRSDIQKVRAVYKPELSYLTDVIVFPSTGCVPLASKLSGGDYDGDAFWVCWEPDLLNGFKNAPAPTNLGDPESFGIQVEKGKLRDVLYGPLNRSDASNALPPPNIDNWLEKSFKFRLLRNLLGQVTKFHEKLTYKMNNISCPEVELLVDLHDLLVDSEKQGYVFTPNTFSEWRRFNLALNQQKLKLTEPAFKQDIKEWQESKEKSYYDFSMQTSHHKHQGSVTVKNPLNALDYIYFEIIKPHIQETLAYVKSALPGDIDLDDDDLLSPLREEEHAARCENEEEIIEELMALSKSLGNIAHQWLVDVRSKVAFADSMNKAYTAFKAIEPINLAHPIISRWQQKLGYLPSRWDLLKASSLATFGKRWSQTLLFNIAGDLLCHIKVWQAPSQRTVVLEILSNMKLKKFKPIDSIPKPVELNYGYEDDGSESDGYEDYDNEDYNDHKDGDGN